MSLSDTEDVDVDDQWQYEDWNEYFPEPPSMELLNNKDYSLNSPLLAKELNSFIEYLRTRLSWDDDTPPSWQRMSTILSTYINQTTLIGPAKFHKWLANFNQIHIPHYTGFQKLMSHVTRDANETVEVVNAFLRGWLKKKFMLKHQDITNPAVLKWGSYYLELHIVTLLVNANTREEKEQILRRFNGKFLIESDWEYGSELSLLNFGKIIVVESVIYLVNHNVILDRNMLLMAKDMYVARFQSLLSLRYRVDNKYPLDVVDKLERLYLLGDEVIRAIGDEGFDYIKLLEPSCNLRLTELAREYRPLIPEFPLFKEHVLKSINKLSSEFGVGTEFFDHVLHEESVEVVLVYYSSFRHWGHPFIDTLAGLEKLYTQVTCEKDIDESYAEMLASDLAYIVLEDQFKKKKKWFVNLEELPRDHHLYPFVKSQTWPTANIIEDFGDNWHKLPLIKAFEIPDVIDPSIIYSDRSHSMNRSEIINHLNKNPTKPIPTKKVLKTLLSEPATDWKEFLKAINDVGLSWDDLVIGLKEKERELKTAGRFFSLMSWKLREYFVITEYLIKTFYVPLFYGLTMADDLVTVMRKMLETSSGQGLDNYDVIYLANHIDYEKWNNHQRQASTGPVFKVMGQFLGYPNLIYRTHEFFEKSLIYYGYYPELLSVVNGEVANNSDKRVCWNGQAGGLEGLRQKGWSILNLLVIRREGAHRNTQVRCLAQGDNQVICTLYKLQKYRTQEELQENIQRVVDNNNVILNRIIKGTERLGLIINRDETMQSADYLNYGKIPFFRGNLRNLETKRWSRVTCVTNDQIPTLANVMSSVTTNALTVAHYSDNPLNTIFHFNFLGNFVRLLIEGHNPALRSPLVSQLKVPQHLQGLGYKIATLYLDPSLGGVCGTSLTRFLIRQFPDPITESLSFARVVCIGTESDRIREIMIGFGNIPLTVPIEPDFNKLIEDPLSINIPKGVNALTLVKNEIKKNLFRSQDNIRNHIIQTAVKYLEEEEDNLLTYLLSIRPMFPRFLSEFKESTYLGITESLVGLFQNSRTIRNAFHKKLNRTIDAIIIKSELISYTNLFKHNLPRSNGVPWDCSASHADMLRSDSWGIEIIGATVPHPIELLSNFERTTGTCTLCTSDYPKTLFVSLLIPNGLCQVWNSRGPYPAYLGSRTSESTSVISPWERTTNIPLIDRAARIRSAIGWFISPNSNLAKSIYNNLRSLTGENWGGTVEGYKRTGSALHRFSCSRQSNGGFAAQSPVNLTRIVTTTSTLQEISEVNYDFMFQSCIIFSQITAGEIHKDNCNHGFYHFHISCNHCLREISEPNLESPTEYLPKDVSGILASWKPDETPWSKEKPILHLSLSDWESISDFKKSFFIGLAEGFLFGEKILNNLGGITTNSLFPLSVGKKVEPQNYIKGVLEGLMRSSSLSVLYRWSVATLNRPQSAVVGGVCHLIDIIAGDTSFQNLLRFPRFLDEMTSIPHHTPPSYPLKGVELGELGRNYMEFFYLKMIAQYRSKWCRSEAWVFSDMSDLTITGLLGVSGEVLQLLYSRKITTETKNKLRSLRDLISTIRSDDPSLELPSLAPFIQNLSFSDQEVRHAAKCISPNLQASPLLNSQPTKWTKEICGSITSQTVDYTSTHQFLNPDFEIPRVQCPLISGLRQFQCATGAHYKVRSIIAKLNIRYRDAIVGGDGSGGLGSMVLRQNNKTRLIFNSLLELDNVNLKGSNPSPPAAIYMVKEIRDRCINLKDAWRNPSDLSLTETWDYFAELITRRNLHINFIVLDMECRDIAINHKIERNLINFIYRLELTDVTVIYKTYGAYLIDPTVSPLLSLGKYFSDVKMVTTQFSSSFSSEVYLVLSKLIVIQVTLFYPDWLQVEEFIRRLPVLSEVQDELNRAISLKSLDLLQGVPSNYHPDELVELVNLLQHLGVLSGTSVQISQVVTNKARVDRSENELLVLLISSVSSILDLNTKPINCPRPPSDETVSNLGSLFTGISLFLSWANEDQSMFLHANKIIRHGFPFNWTSTLEGRRWDKIVSLRYPLRVKKYLYLDHKMALIGQIIRNLSRVFPAKLPSFDSVVTASLLKTIDKRLDRNIFERQTSFLSCLCDGTSMDLEGSKYACTDLFNPTIAVSDI
ncbi:RNA-dependent RNA polymerase [Hubei diptera virus 9]|uniref:Replicase n=1 Tax=Hubei diptera virus 9 TaxID=1922889 RepID=A0A1L3KN50_9RHAB|nr:RNA-dependent RNA polymerase [Hubei diptera virus 9]APG78735.1 RNA-dependent RNA polymerase [Hubei diptera virus 9]